MNNQQRFLNLIGIAKRAGKVVSGEEIILSAIKKHQVNLVIIASDTGQSTMKKFMDKTTFYRVKAVAGVSKAALSDAIGMPRTMIGITDRGFANKLYELQK